MFQIVLLVYLRLFLHVHQNENQEQCHSSELLKERRRKVDVMTAVIECFHSCSLSRDFVETTLTDSGHFPSYLQDVLVGWLRPRG